MLNSSHFQSISALSFGMYSMLHFSESSHFTKAPLNFSQSKLLNQYMTISPKSRLSQESDQDSVFIVISISPIWNSETIFACHIIFTTATIWGKNIWYVTKYTKGRLYKKNKKYPLKLNPSISTFGPVSRFRLSLWAVGSMLSGTDTNKYMSAVWLMWSTHSQNNSRRSRCPARGAQKVETRPAHGFQAHTKKGWHFQRQSRNKALSQSCSKVCPSEEDK